MTYDATDGYVLLFGGVYGGSLQFLGESSSFGDTWTYQDGVWTNLTPHLKSSPDARELVMMAYDPTDKEVVLFGGESSYGNPSTPVYGGHGDTWTFVHGAWTNLTSSLSTAPSPRFRGGMAYDYHDGYLVLYGGSDPSGSPFLSDTWKFVNDRWTNLTSSVSGSPPTWARFSLAYDPTGQELVAFGGSIDPTATTGVDYTWVYQNLAWKNDTQTPSPNGRVYYQMATDWALGGAILYGGSPSSGAGVPMNDTWLFKNGSWTNLTAQFTGNPGQRGYEFLAYDPDGGYLVLFGGYNNNAAETEFNDTWTLGPNVTAFARADPDATDLGKTVTFSTIATPATSGITYSYSGLPSGCSSTNASAFTCQPTVTGLYNFSVTATTTTGSSDSSYTSFNLSGVPSVISVDFAPAIGGVGLVETFSANASGGTGALGYAWSHLPPGCSSSNASSISCTPTKVGTYNVTVTVTDRVGATANGSADLVVNSTYGLIFTESGLPTSTKWGATVGTTVKSSTSASLSFLERNGSVGYSISPVAGYTTNWTGNAVIRGSNVSIAVSFSEVRYNVTFAEKGLATGTNWTVKLGNTTRSTTGAQVRFSEANGTFAYHATSSGRYVAATPYGNETVKGSAATVNVSFESTFTLTFHETGLPTGTNWTVALSSASNASTSANLSFVLPNGTYSYSVHGVAGYETNWTGQAVVSGANTAVAVNFTQVRYAILFTETGLIGGSLWTVNVSGTNRSSGSPTIEVDEPNGTYSYSFARVSGYLGPAPNNLTLDGSGASRSVTFVELFAITFRESGLPALTSWTVILNGTPIATTSSALVFSEANGTYNYTIPTVPGFIAPAPGGIVVAGTDQVESAVFRETFALTFQETGLVGGTRWSVDLASTLRAATGDKIAFVETNGSYNYTIPPVPGYLNPTTGNVSVQGQATVVDVTFRMLFEVTFRSKDLPNGTAWSVTVQGAPNATVSSEIGFFEPNGSYAYSVNGVVGYVFASTGQVTVSGSAVVVTVPFERLYGVTFTETGLPKGTAWTVTLNGTLHPIAGTATSFELTNGSYAYVIGAISGFQTTANGLLKVNGQNASVSVDFVAVYPIAFSETGLPAGTNWSVRIGATTLNSTTATIVFQEPEGPYAYSILPIPGYSTVWSGTIDQTGISYFEPVKFTLVTYPVTFGETGLSTGTNWSLTLTAASGSPFRTGRSTTVWSDGASTITIDLPNGTFTLSSSAPGEQALSATFQESAGVPGVGPTFAYPPNASTGSRFLGLPATEGYGLLGGIVAAAVAAALAGILISRRRRSPPTEPGPGPAPEAEPAAYDLPPSDASPMDAPVEPSPSEESPAPAWPAGDPPSEFSPAE
jgi:hypothetical protein